MTGIGSRSDDKPLMYGTAQFTLDQAWIQQNVAQQVLHFTHMHTYVRVHERLMMY